MNDSSTFEIFLTAPPGLEDVLASEMRLKGFRRPQVVPGGVTIRGGWREVWRANLWLRGAGRVLARLASFHVRHLAQLDALSRTVAWSTVLRADVPVRVDAHCAGSRLYHSSAVAERVGRAIHETLGAPVVCARNDAAEEGTGEDVGNGAREATRQICAPPCMTVMVRIQKDVCVISLDTSGALLHRRGYKRAVNRAPIRETMAALFLMRCGYTGREPLVDPMCGSGTFVIEGAEMAAPVNPGRARPFAFEHLATFDPAAWQAMRTVRRRGGTPSPCYGYDRDAGAVRMAQANAHRAGLKGDMLFAQQPISALVPPAGPSGLVIANPPYGTRIGAAKTLVPLYRCFGQVMRERFSGWRVGLVTSEPFLAQATGLPFLPADAPVPHGGLKVNLWRTAPLP